MSPSLSLSRGALLAPAQPGTRSSGARLAPVWRIQARCRAAQTEGTPGHGPAEAPSLASPRDTPLASVGRLAATAALAAAVAFGAVEGAEARLEGVNKPELLPQGFTRVIDTGGFLSSGQVQRLSEDLGRLEDDTGFKLRVLSQSYPNTPGLAIREYWGVDDDTIVFVADPTFKNILNFNVGATVDLRVPRSFWSRLAGKYGNIFYWRENGEDAAIEAAVVAIDACLREEPGPRQCADIK